MAPIFLMSFITIVHMMNSTSVPADMALNDILNEFQRESSHMAFVVKAKGKSKNPVLASDGEGKSESVVVDIDINRPPSLQQNDASNIVMSLSAEDVEDGEVIGIIIMEDFYERLLLQIKKPSGALDGMLS